MQNFEKGENLVSSYCKGLWCVWNFVRLENRFERQVLLRGVLSPVNISRATDPGIGQKKPGCIIQGETGMYQGQPGCIIPRSKSLSPASMNRSCPSSIPMYEVSQAVFPEQHMIYVYVFAYEWIEKRTCDSTGLNSMINAVIWV